MPKIPAPVFALPSSFLTRLLVAFGSGVLMALAAAPLNWWLLAWIAMIPLWLAVSPRPTPHTPHSTPLFIPLVWSIGYHGLALSWITGLHPLMWLGIPWLASVAITLFCWVFITGWGAALVVAWAWIMGRVENRKGHLLLGVALWCGLEALWSFGPLWWTALSFTQSPGNRVILHLGQLSGPIAVAAAIAAVNGLLAQAWIRYQNFGNGQKRVQGAVIYGAIALVLFLSLHGLGFVLANQPLNDAETAALKVGIIQGNVPTRIKLFSEGIRRAEEGYARGYETLVQEGADAVLTPEGSLPYLWNPQNQANSLFYQALVRQGKPVWLGTFTADNGKVARSLLSLAGQKTWGRYDKIKLVPLGEYIPFQEVLGGLIGKLTTIAENGSPGNFDQRFDTPFGRAIASICYDSAFPEVFRRQAAQGGQLILTASNLDPYSQVLMAQHQAQDVMRAIESDRWAVRATNTGYSGILDPHGQILWQSQPNIYQIHSDIVYRRQTKTLYVRWGDWLTPLLMGMAAVVISMQLLSKQPT